MRLSRLVLTALPLALAAPALASDGALQINQACAVQTGCFTGDTAGFPVTIGTPGSYVLTGNLVVPNENTTAIALHAPDIRIDLNGFEIVRNGCQTASCTRLPGSGGGVVVALTSYRGVVVRNGNVTGMGDAGVSLGEQAQVAGVSARSNGSDGIRVSSASIVSGCATHSNGGSGIAGSNGVNFSANVAWGNVRYGIDTSFGATATANTTYLNGWGGIATDHGSTVSGNTVYGNTGHGIFADAGSLVAGNSVRSNSFRGLELGAGATYRENTITGNTTGTVLGGVNRGDNYCEGTGVVSELCP